MEIKRQIEVLEMIKEGLVNKQIGMCLIIFGICHILIVLSSEKKLSSKENRFITNLLNEHKPTPENEYKEFTQNDYWGVADSGFWWSPMMDAPETRQIRIDYITKLISNLK